MKVPSIAAVAMLAALAAPASATDAEVSFKDKTVTMIIPTTAGAGTDLSARLIARFFTKYLPGQPTFIASNVPSGHGVTALNYLVEQAKPDGTAVTMGSTSQADPMTYRTPQAHYNPTELQVVGGMGIGDNVMIIRADALPRLTDKTAQPVTMGSVPGIPRSAMRMALWGSEYLGWNMKWVVGYPGSSDLVLALERGEIDMTSFPRGYVVDKLTDSKVFKALYLDSFDRNGPPSGRADFDNAPLFLEAMADKIKDPAMQAAYDYWLADKVFKWLALPPKTPIAVRDAYRTAFLKLTVDPDFTKQAAMVAGDFTIISPERMTKMIHDLATTSDETLDTMDALMRKQGLNIPQKRS